MYTCEICKIDFDKWQQKANHVRWNHKDRPYSEEGMRTLRQKVVASNEKRFGKKEWEDVPCPKCNQIFTRRKNLARKKQYCQRTCAALSRVHTEETKAKISESLRRNEKAMKQSAINITKNNQRCSSKIERALAKRLGENFKRHKVVRTQHGFIFDVDIVHKTRKIWVESDGPFHFYKVHKNHDFEKSKKRDEIENRYAIDNGYLLVRVKNTEYSLEEQVEFIMQKIGDWDETGRVEYLY